MGEHPPNPTIAQDKSLSPPTPCRGDPNSDPSSLRLCFCRRGKDLDQSILPLQWALSPTGPGFGHNSVKVEDTFYSCPCCSLSGGKASVLTEAAVTGQQQRFFLQTADTIRLSSEFHSLLRQTRHTSAASGLETQRGKRKGMLCLFTPLGSEV